MTATNDGAGTTSYQYYPGTHVSAGRLQSQTNAAGKKVYFNYTLRGEMIQTWGDTTYPIEYVFDSYGQRTEMHTFRNGAGWTASSWPSAGTGAADVTKWIYHDATGLVAQKQDAVAKAVVYTFDEMGRLKTRAWARGIICTYSYDPNTGEMTGLSYSDSTSPATFAYDRGGRQKTITDAAGTHARTFTATGELQTEQITGGILDSINLNVGYDSFLRRNSLQSSSGANVLSSQTYGYDSTSRLQTVTSGSLTATYAYYPNSGLLNTTTFTSGTQMARSYDSLGRLQSIATTTPTAGTVASYGYQYNNLNQRTRVNREDGSYWLYFYNDRGELISGKKYWADNSPVWGAQTENSYDTVGNRIYAKSGGNQLNQLRQSTLTTNSLNQYSQRSVPGAVDITGTANSAATVTVNDQSTARKGDYFYRELAVDNTAGPVNAQITVTGARQNFGAGGEDAVTQQGGHTFLPQAAESFTFDFDGNLTSDGHLNYSWDAENRLLSMEAIPSVPVDGRQRLEFVYDAMARRVQKKVYAWNISTSTYQLQSTTKFVYDGWNLVAEVDGNNNLVRNYVRGAGELLLVNGGGDTHQVGYDGNQNVGVLVKGSDGSVSASYDYDPFGQTMKAVGGFAMQNPFRFSDQYADVESGLIYYGFRYYNPQIGRWINRDPSGELGGVGLYGFVGNDTISSVDHLGLWKRIDTWAGKRGDYSGTVEAECGDNLSTLAVLITGYASDWHFLGISEDLKPRQQVKIGPLLARTEERLRVKVLDATSRFQAVGFPDPPRHPPTEVANSAAGVNTFFAPNNFYVGCALATRIVMAKGLIDFLRHNEFDRLGYTPGDNLPFDSQGADENGMKVGDMGWVQSYAGERDIVWQAENIIKVGNDSYWAFPFSQGLQGISMSSVKSELATGYRQLRGRPGTGEMIGLQHNTYFLNVSRIGMDVFKFRGGKE